MDTKYVETDGAFINANVHNIMNSMLESTLLGLGLEGQRLMRKNMQDAMVDQKSYTGKTVASVQFATSNLPPDTQVPDSEIEQPKENNVVYVGTNYSVASYLENGTPPHATPNGKEEFIANITGWLAYRNIPEDEWYPIIRSIRENGTKPHPYLQQTSMELNDYARKIVDRNTSVFVKIMNSKNPNPSGVWGSEVTE